jgi:hypothetical protein
VCGGGGGGGVYRLTAGVDAAQRQRAPLEKAAVGGQTA